MRNRNSILFAILLLLIPLSLYAGSPQAETGPEVEYPESVVPGSILSIVIGDEPQDGGGEERRTGFFAELLDKDGKPVTKGKSFEAEAAGTESESRRSRFILLGVPNTLDPGTYVLRLYRDHVDGRNAQGRYSDESGEDGAGENGEEPYLEDEIEVSARSFEEDVIPLRKSLTSLRRTPDPRKAEEAREIRSLYARFDPGAVYDMESWIVPVEYKYITSRFGDRRKYEYQDGATARAIHSGVDFAASTGTPVTACGGGVVKMAKDRIISGYTVVLEHLPGVYSIYFHLDSLDVERGERVDRGDILGTVGMTGLATGPHLHWEIRVQGVAVDPWVLTKKGLFETIAEDKEQKKTPEEEGG